TVTEQQIAADAAVVGGKRWPWIEALRAWTVAVVVRRLVHHEFELQVQAAVHPARVRTEAHLVVSRIGRAIDDRDGLWPRGIDTVALRRRSVLSLVAGYTECEVAQR